MIAKRPLDAFKNKYQNKPEPMLPRMPKNPSISLENFKVNKNYLSFKDFMANIDKAPAPMKK